MFQLVSSRDRRTVRPTLRPRPGDSDGRPSVTVQNPPAVSPDGTAHTAPAPLPTMLQSIVEAYIADNAPLGERLLLRALDDGLPWDAVCAAAARGIAARREAAVRA